MSPDMALAIAGGFALAFTIGLALVSLAVSIRDERAARQRRDALRNARKVRA